MISPSARALWLVGIVFVPACAFPAFAPNGELYVAASALFVLAACAIDFLISTSRLAGLNIVLPETIRAVLNENASFPIELHRSDLYRGSSAGRPLSKIRVAVALPSEVEPIQDDILMPAPEPAQGLKTELSFLGRERGKFSVTQAFLGCPSRFGFWELRCTLAVQSTILVQPALSQISKDAARLLAAHRHGGQRIVARNGRGREFEQLREYVPNDDFGSIDWKATARRRLPIVRDYQIERTQDIYACIDFSRLSGRPVVRQDKSRATILDEYVRSTLLLHCAVRETGDRFGFATFSNRAEYFIRATHARSFERVFRQGLYPLRPKLVAPAFDEICNVLRSRIKRRALIVFFTSLAEPQLAESFLEACRLLVRQHLVVVACATDAHTQPLFSELAINRTEEIYDQLAGHLLWKKLAEVRVQLTGIGVRMHAVAPGRLGLVAATDYLDIKERQLL